MKMIKGLKGAFIEHLKRVRFSLDITH